MHVYTTPRLRDDLQKQGLQAEFDKLVKALESIDTVRAMFDPLPPYWKRKLGIWRLLAKIVRVGDDQIICFIDILQRKDEGYTKFLNDPRGVGKNYLEPLLDQDDLRRSLTVSKKLHKDKQRQIRSLNPVPEAFRPWLNPPGWRIKGDEKEMVIYESEEWVKRFRRKEIDNFWQTYHKIVLSIVNETTNTKQLNKWPGIRLAYHNSRCLLFSKIETADIPARQVLFLLAPFKSHSSDTEIGQVVKQTHPAYAVREASDELSRPQLRLAEVARFARRAYPAYMLADAESWLTIEREKEANLALSPEEEQILKSVSISEHRDNALPIFINGRAGSGKSTMLFYLFADYCYRKWQQKFEGEPIFLTYNERLVDIAKDRVKKLLLSHHRFLEERTEENDLQFLDAFFQPFQNFLLNLLPSDVRVHFEQKRYISFHRFKQLYMGEPLHWPLPQSGDPQARGERERVKQERKLALLIPEAKNWSPELCWYIIRTFIKGYSLNGYMDPNDYQEVPRRERTISNDEFKQIYKIIWKPWYRQITTDQGCWDDQDLIRKVLELKCYHPKYIAVFCDEAQDFTRLEIQLIMRLSVFSQYDLGYQPVHSLPFAFAGDPFQTLNPTGFRWSSVRAVFYEEVIRTLDPVGQLGLGMNFQDLAYNYRSTPPIVRVTNLIQLWRHVLFNLSELQPQGWWQQGEFPDPQKFILGRNISLDILIQHIQNTIIIVPCEEGEEVSFIREDEVLRKIIVQGSEEEPPKNVLSAITAKGLEFKRVILYKFGEKCDSAVWKLLNQPQDHPVESEYFFNKLYVAATRAMERLFVVDSKEGDDAFWKYASTPGELEPFLQKVKKRADWGECIQAIPMGTAASDMSEEDLRSIAEEFKRKGLSLQNPNLLRRAKQYYSMIGETTEVDVCEGWALKFEEKYSKAGEIFLSYGNADQAWECFWEGMCWEELVAWYEKYGRNRMHDLARDLAIFRSTNPKDVSAIKSFTEFLNRCSGSSQLGNPFSRQWRTVINKYAQRVSGLDEHDLQQDEWRQSGDILRELDRAGYRGLLDYAGSCLYRAQEYKNAADCWEQCGVTQKSDYYLAKAKAVGFPDSLKWLAKLPDSGARILEVWEKAGGLISATDRRWLEYVGPSLERKKRYHEALQVFIKLEDMTKLLKCLTKASKVLSSSDLWKAIVPIIYYLIQQSLWVEVIGVLNKYFPKVVGLDAEKTGLGCDIVRELAYSDLKPEDLTIDEQSRYEKLSKEVQSTQDWRQRLSPKEVGSAMERIGSIIDTLRFYESIVSDTDPEIQRFARERWIATKRRHEDYLKRQGQETRAEKILIELANKADDWGIRSDIELSLYPLLEPRHEISVHGVPLGTRMEKFPNGSLKFKVGRIEVRMDRPKKRVLLTDTHSLMTLLIDLKRGEISGQAGVILKSGESNRVPFEVPESGYSGIAVYEGEKKQLELRLKGVAEKISFEF